MICSVGRVIRLCWILSCLLPLIYCQTTSKGNDMSNGNGGNGSNGKNGRTRKGSGRFHGGRGKNGRFGANHGKQSGMAQGAQGGQGQQNDGEDQSSQDQEGPEPTAAESDFLDMPMSTSFAQVASLPVPALVSAATLPASTIPIFIPPSSIAYAVGEPMEPSGVSIATIPLTSSSMDNDMLTVDIPMPTSTITVVTSMTIMVTASPEAVPTTSSPTTSIDLAPLSTSPGTTMNSSAKAGIGIGITFAIVTIASIIGICLYRRRRHRFNPTNNANNTKDSSSSNSNSQGLGNFFRFRNREKNDQEWEIQSVEKVQIMRGATPSTIGRSEAGRTDSKGGDGLSLHRAGSTAGTEVLRVGMQLPDRPRPNPALTSNPISPITVVSPIVPIFTESKAARTGSWPLPD